MKQRTRVLRAGFILSVGVLGCAWVAGCGSDSGTVIATGDSGSDAVVVVPPPMGDSSPGTPDTAPPPDTGAPLGPPSASISATSLTFGNVDCGGAAPGNQMLTIQNKGGGSVVWNALLDNTTFFDFVGTHGGTLGAGQSATITIKALAMPSSANAGDIKQASLAITTDDKAASLTYIPVNATAQGATLTVTPATAGFGDVPLSTFAPNIPLAIKNTGNASATITLSQPGNTDFSVALAGSIGGDAGAPEGGAGDGGDAGAADAGAAPPATVTIAAGATSSAVLARFRPTSITPATTSSPLAVAGAVCGVSATSVAMTGRGANGVVGVSPTSFDFGQVSCGATGAAQNVTLFNTGTAPYNFSTAFTAGATTAYTVSPASGTVLANGQLQILVTPKRVPQTSAITPNLYGATLTVTTTSTGDSPHAITLGQTASGAILAFSAPSINFGNQAVSVASAPQNVSVLNTGNAAASIALTPGSSAYAAPAPASVAGGGSLTRGITFTPPGYGAFPSTLALSTTDAICSPLPSPVNLTGTGTAPNGVIISVSPNSLDFGQVACGTTGSAQAVTLFNTGAPSFTFNAALSAGATAAYTLTPASGTVLTGGQIQILVSPRAIPQTSAVTPNLYGATLTITTNAAGDTPHSVPLTETASGAILAFSAPSLTFGNQPLFVPSAPQNIDVVNSGNASASVTLTPSTGAFGAPSAATVNAASSLTRGITFAPLNFSAQAAATLTVATTDTLCAPLPAGVTLSGNGIGQALQISVGETNGRNRFGGTSAGRATTCAVIQTGRVACWGDNSLGQLGTVGLGSSTIPVLVPGLTNVTQVSANDEFNCARLSDGTVSCWGSMAGSGSGGRASGPNYGATPVQISGLTTATAISTNHRHACALTSAGTVFCWGVNGRGQLGNGAPVAGGGVSVATPVQVSNLTNATAIAVNSSGACALRSDGTITCWGPWGNRGATWGSVPGPALGGITTFTQVAGGGFSGGRGSIDCARRADSTVLCWGDGSHSKLGNNSCLNTSGCQGNTPLVVSNITTATAVSSGGHNSCALLADGSVSCWGRNQAGEVGNGTSAEQPVPVPVAGVTGAVQVSAGSRGACAIVANGAVTCWGRNNGSSGSSLVPQRVTYF